MYNKHTKFFRKIDMEMRKMGWLETDEEGWSSEMMQKWDSDSDMLSNRAV